MDTKEIESVRGEALRALRDDGPAVEAEYAKVVADEGRLLDAIKAGSRSTPSATRPTA